MSLLFGPSRRDRRHAVQALRELGPTSIPGLAAALSWSDRKTVRVLRGLASSPANPVRYDAATRQVRADRPRTHSSLSGASSPPVPHPGDGAHLPRGDPVGADVVAPIAPAPAAVPSVSSRWGGSGSCPSCSSALELTATGEALVCRNCGRLSLLTTGGARGGSPTRSARPESVDLPSPEAPASDRKAQELFAAYVTSQPIPCPKCRIPMRHRSLAEYVCPSCGHSVRFPSPPGATRAAPLSPARASR